MFTDYWPIQINHLRPAFVMLQPHYIAIWFMVSCNHLKLHIFGATHAPKLGRLCQFRLENCNIVRGVRFIGLYCIQSFVRVLLDQATLLREGNSPEV